MTRSTGTHTFHITGMCSRTNKPATLTIYILLYFYCSLLIDPTLLHTSVKNKKMQHLLTKLLQNMCQTEICPSNVICMPYALIMQCASIGEVCATYELTGINYVTWRAVHRQCQMMMMMPMTTEDDAA